MATFQKKYYYTFRDIKNAQYTTELWQYTGATLTAQEIKADDNPFTVTYSPTNNKFDQIRGSGCDINIVSVTGLSFLNLYTTDMMGYQIRFFNSASTLLWVGYLSSELYSEPFNEYNNYTVTLTGNDGLSLLERLDYLTSGSTNYTGFTFNWNIITTILQRLNISWNAIYVGLSTTSSEVTINSGNTILSTTYSNNENFYDEDGKAMNCKEVLETILTPFSAFIQIINGSIYITDVNTLAQGNSQTFKRYNGTTFVYETNVSINLALGDVSTIDFASNSQTLNILSPINKQKVIFSPYITNSIIDYNTDNDVFRSGISYSYGSSTNTWVESGYSYSNYWDKNNATNLSKGSPRFSESYGTNSNAGTNDKYLTIGSGNTALPLTTSSFSWKGKVPNMIINSNYFLKMEAKCYVRTKDDMGGAAGTITAKSCKVWCNLIIGDKKFSYDSTSSVKQWLPSTTTGATFELHFINVSTPSSGVISDASWNVISDTWTDLNEELYNNPDRPFYIPLNSATVGNNFYFDIYGYGVYDDTQSIIANRTITSTIKDIRLKDIKLTIVDNKFNDVSNNDIEYWSYVDKTVKDNGGDITCKLGTNTSNFPIAKGSIIGYNGSNYFNIQSFTRSGTTDIVENLLARSVVSNYTSKTIEIQCVINRIESIFGTLKYNNYWSGFIFGIQGAVIDYHEATIDLTLQQLEDDSLTISKNYT